MLDLATTKPSADDVCDMKYLDTGYVDYENWAEDYLKCNPNAHSCAFLNIYETGKNWEAENCAGMEAWACEVKPGDVIHSIPKPIDPYHCETEALVTFNNMSRLLPVGEGRKNVLPIRFNPGASKMTKVATDLR
jgi:hypothetical protein